MWPLNQNCVAETLCLHLFLFFGGGQSIFVTFLPIMHQTEVKQVFKGDKQLAQIQVKTYPGEMKKLTTSAKMLRILQHCNKSNGARNITSQTIRQAVNKPTVQPYQLKYSILITPASLPKKVRNQSKHKSQPVTMTMSKMSFAQYFGLCLNFSKPTLTLSL